MPFVEVNGTRIAYVEEGRGEAVFFVHGSLADLRSWSQQMEPFSRGFRAIAYSRRYHYPNPFDGNGDYSAALHAQDLAALIQAVGPGHAHLVASSFGAYIALLLAVKKPDLVRTLVLAEPPLLPWLEGIPGGDALLAAFLSAAWEPSKNAFQQGDAELGVRYFLDGVLGSGSYDRMPATARTGMLENALEIRAGTTSEGHFSPLTREDARRIQKPALLLNGDSSPKMFHLITEEMARCLPHVERATIPAASHTMHLANPLAFNETVLAFLGRRLCKKT